MNTIKMPGFTAASALYRTSGHYQTRRQAINSPTQMISAIHPAAETIEVFGCPPGSTMVGTPPDDWYCFLDPLTEPSWGGGGPLGGGGGGGGGGGTGPKPKPKPKPKKPYYSPERCSKAHLETEKGQQCSKRLEQDLINGVKNPNFPVCGKKLSEVLCCTGGADGGPYFCDVEKVDG